MTARELIKQLKETPDAEVHIALGGISYNRVIEYGKKHGGSVTYLRPKTVIDYASRYLNLHTYKATSGFCYCIMHIDDNELAEYYLKDIVEDAACIHGGDNANWDCVFMICKKMV